MFFMPRKRTQSLVVRSARAYIDMGDGDLATPLLDEILEEGSDEQVDEARELIVA